MSDCVKPTLRSQHAGGRCRWVLGRAQQCHPQKKGTEEEAAWEWDRGASGMATAEGMGEKPELSVDRHPRTQAISPAGWGWSYMSLSLCIHRASSCRLLSRAANVETFLNASQSCCSLKQA